MRSAELISILFFATVSIGAVVLPLARPRLERALGLGAAGILLATLLPLLSGLPGGEVVRDLAPALLLLIGYWQTGQFLVRRNDRFQALLERVDRRWLPRPRRAGAGDGDRSPLGLYLEAAYLACYPVVPLGVGALYLGGRSDMVDPFWTVVLTATFATHALTTRFQSWPPWMMDSAGRPDVRSSAVGSVNQWLTNHASIRLNSFPSGHVASSAAVGLVVLAALPAVGLVFLWIAGSIAVASVVLRYHYGLDVVLGLAVAGVSFALLGPGLR